MSDLRQKKGKNESFPSSGSVPKVCQLSLLMPTPGLIEGVLYVHLIPTLALLHMLRILQGQGMTANWKFRVASFILSRMVPMNLAKVVLSHLFYGFPLDLNLNETSLTGEALNQSLLPQTNVHWGVVWGNTVRNMNSRVLLCCLLGSHDQIISHIVCEVSSYMTWK